MIAALIFCEGNEQSMQKQARDWRKSRRIWYTFSQYIVIDMCAACEYLQPDRLMPLTQPTTTQNGPLL